MSDTFDKKIICSWKTNAKAWVKAIQSNVIESRVQVTNQAIMDAVTSCKPRTVLDIGCGEGWLCRELESLGIRTMGVDIIPELIDQAQAMGHGCFQQMSYEQLAEEGLQEKFDIVVCNFSLLGKKSVEAVLKRVPNLLNLNGHFIVQTLHPIAACGEHEYKDGWRQGSWAGFSAEFSNPAPWYFRTMESWRELFSKNHFKELKTLEPEMVETRKKASLILISRYSANKE